LEEKDRQLDTALLRTREAERYAATLKARESEILGQAEALREEARAEADVIREAAQSEAALMRRQAVESTTKSEAKESRQVASVEAKSTTAESSRKPPTKSASVQPPNPNSIDHIPVSTRRRIWAEFTLNDYRANAEADRRFPNPRSFRDRSEFFSSTIRRYDSATRSKFGINQVQADMITREAINNNWPDPPNPYR